jgi:signal recognition particle subunit SEC65
MKKQVLPKIIKKKRNKKYTEYRTPYKSYNSAKWKWSDIFIEIDNLKSTSNTFLKDISNKYGIIYSTLRNKYNKRSKNKSDKNINNEKRGGSNKALTNNDENNLYNHIKTIYIDNNRPLTNAIIKQLAINEFNNNLIDEKKTFNASDGWCTEFKKRWSLSTQRIKPSKIATKKPTTNEINKFIDTYNKKRKVIKDKNIFNFDEIGINIANPPKTAIRLIGSECTKLDCKENLKEKTTIGLTISLGGSILKPLLITKGQTTKCLEKYDLTDEIIGAHSNKGWINSDCLKLILDQIVKKTKNEKSLLILDQYKVHKIDEIKLSAKEKNIDLLYVPTGMTYKYQPLDVKINGILKSKMSNRYVKYVTKDNKSKYTHSLYVKDLLGSLKELNKGTIIRSFDCLKMYK